MTAVFKNYCIDELTEIVRTKGWQYVKDEFSKEYKSLNNICEKNIYIDMFFSLCFKVVTVTDSCKDMWMLIKEWFIYRKIPQRCFEYSEEEKTALLFVCMTVRHKLTEFFENSSLECLALDEEYQKIAVWLWKYVFLNPFSLLNIQSARTKMKEVNALDIRGLMIKSMYCPFDADECSINFQEIYNGVYPQWCKSVILFWLINIPYYNGNIKHLERLNYYVPKICSTLIKHPEKITFRQFESIVQEMMTMLWRGSYLDGNNIISLYVFGDFISFFAKLFFPAYNKVNFYKQHKTSKIRVGYISRNFYKQAVGFYMVNRIIHHDKNNFETVVFSLGEQQDEISKLFAEYSDEYKIFPDVANYNAIIDAIVNSHLDILVYTDIGMDAVTYILAGLRLAPVQCAMAGHGTTTGMPEIDYYMSGDFEVPSAQAHYREKLICLPCLGAAQYIPQEASDIITRKKLNIPEDAVLFISCANGIKHGAQRDFIFIEILKRVPKAYILLKPFPGLNSTYPPFINRLMQAALKEGVADRLKIIPALQDSQCVINLLKIADVQLDTYPYGGWTTNLEALFTGLPIISQEGEMARSRWGGGMLKALGIKDGIAANEQEYIEWAVQFATDKNRLEQIRKKITAKSREVFFNGAKAQQSFEEELKTISGKQQKNIYINSHIRALIATSIANRDINKQRCAIDSWKEHGFSVTSLNTAGEIAALQGFFPDVHFVEVKRDGTKLFKKPYIYINDILNYLAEAQAYISGIMNSDIILMADIDIIAFLSKHIAKSLLYGARVDVSFAHDDTGKVYTAGFDYFFFQFDVIKCYPEDMFFLGLPWWDYWAIIVPMLRQYRIKHILNPFARHIKHNLNYNKNAWLELFQNFVKYVPSQSNISDEKISYYSKMVLDIIRTNSQDVFY